MAKRQLESVVGETIDDHYAELEKTWDDEDRARADAFAVHCALVNDFIEARKRAGLTQQEVAERASVPQSSISRFESGTGNVSQPALERIAVALGAMVRLVPSA